MNIFQKLFGSKMKSIRQPFTSGVTVNRYSGLSSIFNAKRDSTIKQYRNWVYSAISARSEDVANIELKLFRGDEEVYENPLLDLLHKVNPMMTQFELFEATQAFKDLEGNCFWFLAREEKADGMGEIKEIYVLRPDRVSIVCDKDNPLIVSGYVYLLDGGGKVPMGSTEVIHFRNFNPKASHPMPHKGMSVIEAAWSAINTDNEMRKYNTAFFENSAKPDGLLIPSSDSAMSSEEYDRLKSQWEEEHKGSGNSHKVAIMTGGLKWQEIGRSQNDMQFAEQLKMTRDEILAIFRVPKSIVGLTDDVNRANAETAIYMFSLKVVKPLMQRIVDTINEFLVPSFGDDLEFRFVSPVPEDKDAKRADYVAGIDKWYTRNEIREELGLTLTENGDVFFGTLNQIEIDRVQPEKAKRVTNPKPQKKTIARKTVEDFIAKLPEATKSFKEIDPKAKALYVESWKSYLVENENPLKKKLGVYFDKQEEQVLRNLKNELKGLDTKEFAYKGVSDVIFDTDNAVNAGISLITPFLRQYVAQSGSRASLLAGTEGFDEESASTSKFVAGRAKYFAETINETTSKDLMKTLEEGVANNEGIPELSERIAEVYKQAKDYRTDRIARTEISASGNFGAKEAYIQAGVEKHQWVAIVDDTTAEICLSCDGQVVGIDKEFVSGNETPPNHPNCRCTTLPVFEE